MGEVIDDRYRVTWVHQEGATGVVYRVRHLAWDIDLAVKSPRPELFRDEEDWERFAAEARTWVSLGLHPHVCHCYYVRFLADVPRVFAEYVAGGSLHDWISDRRLYDGERAEVLARILDIGIQTARGLDHAHGRGLVHRDVKPANILLDPGGDAVTAKITDFGLARARDLAATLSPDAPPRGASALVPGDGQMTPLYASPEQTARRPVGRRTDIHSFAVSVLAMCVGEATWMSGTVAGAALATHRGDDPDAIPPTLGALLERCLSEDPDKRPKSMAEVATDLIAVYRDVTGHAYPRSEPVLADLLTDELHNRAVSLLDLDRHTEAVIGRTVVFAPLTRPALRRIADKLIDRVRAQLADRAITINLTDDAYDLLVQHGIGAPAGARALEPAVERLLVQPLGRTLLAGRFADGTSIRVEAADGKLTCTCVDLSESAR